MGYARDKAGRFRVLPASRAPSPNRCAVRLIVPLILPLLGFSAALGLITCAGRPIPRRDREGGPNARLIISARNLLDLGKPLRLAGFAHRGGERPPVQL